MFKLACLLLSVSLAGLGAATAKQAVQQLENTPLHFVGNHGQFPDQILYAVRDTDHSLYLTAEGVTLTVEDGRLAMEMIGGREGVEVTGAAELEGKINYFIGNDPSRWRTGLPTFARVRYREVYPGIDLVFHGNRGRLEYDFVVRAGVAPTPIRLRFHGAGKLRLRADGALVARMGGGDVIQPAPVIYQTVGGERHSVAGRFVLRGENEIAFAVDDYDETRPLVIDPVLEYSTYLGGGTDDRGRGIVVDGQGYAYVTGMTLSANFPTQNPFQGAIGGAQSDAFVTKFRADGSGVVYSTYLGGGASGEIGYGIAVDSDGNAYIAGSTSSLDFPVTAGAFQQAKSALGDAFVSKLDPTGSQLVYSTYLGGDRGDSAFGIDVDAAGHAYVTGQTASFDFPTSATAFQTTRGAAAGAIEDAFVAKLSNDGTALAYSTYLGGADTDRGIGIVIDPDGFAYVTGTVRSLDFPTKPAAFQGTFAGAIDAFVTKVNQDGSDLVYSTYFGGANVEQGHGIALDWERNAYITGETLSNDMPTTTGVFQPQRASNADGFISKFSANGSSLLYSTYLGGGNREHGQAIAVDLSMRAYVIGWTTSVDFPQVNPLPGIPGGSSDLYVARINQDASQLLFSTKLGGSEQEKVGGGRGDGGGNAITVDDVCGTFVTGFSESTDFPTFKPFQPAVSGADDAVVAKIDPFVVMETAYITCGGAVLATQTPVIRKLSPLGIGTVFGQAFAPEGTLVISPELDPGGNVTANLANTCVEVDGFRSPVFAVVNVPPNPAQVNFQVSHLVTPGIRPVRVISGCGTGNEVVSPPEYVEVLPATPGFFNFVNNLDGVNPIAAIHQNNVNFVGPPDLFGGGLTTPAVPGEFISVFFTGGGPTNPSFAAGQIATSTASVTNPSMVFWDGQMIPPDDVFYIGVAPGTSGQNQGVFKVPENATAGNHSVRFKIGDYLSPEGPFIAVTTP